ncbi:hypothetical protein LOZ53_000505 [Ophidiomyces ophidiicola]|nr:hypothetical protein LOZ55_000827 [Ophidiomyces ophidiicola]KAI1992384.1 hypothetical protein LOZ54_001733 [Ophidiomyces ophidiicola]KAI1997498.1 hypothetical protein LOZ53_000505 [Ophidiomyces ophidiicola]KAI1998011.1 hypothetical protein LOZ51_002685 [Ophidiomyces ophidiicola]
MDLVAGVRKEGSRGGRDAFKWSDVKDSSHRENYLGHSLMAPVGRWQQRRDLSWYAKNDGDGSPHDAGNERNDEIQRIKEAEQEAMAQALGLPVNLKIASGANAARVTGLSVQKIVKEATTTGSGSGVDRVSGIGFGAYNGTKGAIDSMQNGDRLEAIGNLDDKCRETHDNIKDDTVMRQDIIDRRLERRSDRSQEKERHRDRMNRCRRGDYDVSRHERRRHRSRSPGCVREKQRSRSRSRDRRRREERRRFYQERSPTRHRDNRYRPDEYEHRRRR